MLTARESRYAQAHIIVDTQNRGPEAVVDAIARELASPEFGAE